jgi:acyl carrier protein
MDTQMMDRLKDCFLTVFPGINPAEIDRASSNTVEKWDSLRAVTLVAVIEEEFQIEFDMEDILSFTSFRLIHDCTMKKLSSPVTEPKE